MDFPENKDLSGEDSWTDETATLENAFGAPDRQPGAVVDAPIELPASAFTFPESPSPPSEDLWQDEPDKIEDWLVEQPRSDNQFYVNKLREEAPVFEEPFAPLPYTAETPEENVRRSGLAWSAGIAFFGSVAFTLFLGWLADLILGSSPWGIVGGIVLGSVIGFIQFFRISSQIFGPKKPRSDIRSLMSHDNLDE